jgi:hypothetical protein
MAARDMKQYSATAGVTGPLGGKLQDFDPETSIDTRLRIRQSSNNDHGPRSPFRLAGRG